MDKKTAKSLNSAFASAKMEGFVITPKIESDCIKIINGDVSIADYISQAKQANVVGVSENG